MLYDPIKQTLYTRAGQHLKKLHCPLHKNWNQLSGKEQHRTCDQCQKTVYNTAAISESDLIQLLEKEPSACIKVDINQANLQLHHAW